MVRCGEDTAGERGGAGERGEAALSLGRTWLYEAIFKHYTKKQWDKYPEELDASVLMRLPCRTTTDDRYFSDAWQALPRRGTREFLKTCWRTIPTSPCDWSAIISRCERVGKFPDTTFGVHGQIDSYYAAMGMPRLEYRSVALEEEYVEDADEGYYQEAMVVITRPDVPYTRIVEYKHLPNQPEGRHERPGTIIAREYWPATGEPTLVPNPANRALYERYAELAANEKNVAFVGRLASYKYFNMDEAILNALEMFDNLLERVLDPKRQRF